MKTLRKEIETLTNSQKGIKETFENYQKGNGNPHKRSERKSKKEMKTLRKEMETFTNSRKGNRKNMKTLSGNPHSQKGNGNIEKWHSQKGNGNPHSQKGNGNIEKWQH